MRAPDRLTRPRMRSRAKRHARADRLQRANAAASPSRRIEGCADDRERRGDIASATGATHRTPCADPFPREGARRARSASVSAPCPETAPAARADWYTTSALARTAAGTWRTHRRCSTISRSASSIDASLRPCHLRRCRDTGRFRSARRRAPRRDVALQRAIAERLRRACSAIIATASSCSRPSSERIGRL